MKTIDSDLYKKIGIKIKHRREEKKYSLQDVSDKMNLYFKNNNIDKQCIRQTLNKIELGKIRIDNDVFNALAEVLEFSQSELFLSAINIDNAKFIELSNDTVRIPVLGYIKAGIPIEAQEDIIDYIDIPKDWTKGDKKFYGLKISGNSMAPKYNENEIVIFEYVKDYSKSHNKDCAVMINCTECTFKKVFLDNDGITLQPYNNEYQAMRFTKEQSIELPITIIGIAVEKRVKL